VKLVGLMLARNEDWILGYSLRAALTWCDEVVVLDHDSTDDTAKILSQMQDEYRRRVHWLFSSCPTWPEMSHRERTLDAGRKRGGTHFAIIDADEVLTANLAPEIRPRIERLAAGEALELPLIPVWRDPFVMRVDDCVWTRAYLTLAFQDQDGLHWATTGYQHHARTPKGVDKTIRAKVAGGVMHYQWADWDRVLWKHRWYKMMERVRYPEKRVEVVDEQYSLALNEIGARFEMIPKEWFSGYPRGPASIRERTPWHKAACLRMWVDHGPDAFEGLDLFGWWGRADG